MSRQQAVDYLLSVVAKMPNAEQNVALYKETFEGMDDSDWEQLKKRHQEEDFVFPIYVYNMAAEKVDVDKVIDVGTKEGVEFFQALNLTDYVTEEPYQTPEKYLILEIPVRRQVHHLIKKLSVRDGNAVDHLAGQATGDSKAAGISLNELTQLDARGLKAAPIELIKVRGGDDTAYRNMIQSLKDTGEFSLGPIMEEGSKPKAVTTLRSLLLGRHLKPTGLDSDVY